MIYFLIANLLVQFLRSGKHLFLTYDFCNDTYVQVLLRSRLSSPSMVFKGEIAGQDCLSPHALFVACTHTLQEVKHICFSLVAQIQSLISSILTVLLLLLTGSE